MYYKHYDHKTKEYLGCVWCEGGIWFSEDRAVRVRSHESGEHARLHLTIQGLRPAA